MIQIRSRAYEIRSVYIALADGKDVFMRASCLPDTEDARGPKGVGR